MRFWKDVDSIWESFWGHFSMQKWYQKNEGKSKFIVEQPGIYIRISSYSTEDKTVFTYFIDGISKLWELKRINKFVQAIAEAPAPFTTTFIFFIDFFEISKALISAAVVIIAVPC